MEVFQGAWIRPGSFYVRPAAGGHLLGMAQVHMAGQKIQHRPRPHRQLAGLAHIHGMDGLQISGIEILQQHLQPARMQIVPGVIERQPRQARPGLGQIGHGFAIVDAQHLPMLTVTALPATTNGQCGMARG
jgi:hypothetical protein